MANNILWRLPGLLIPARDAVQVLFILILLCCLKMLRSMADGSGIDNYLMPAGIPPHYRFLFLKVKRVRNDVLEVFSRLICAMRPLVWKITGENPISVHYCPIKFILT